MITATRTSFWKRLLVQIAPPVQNPALFGYADGVDYCSVFSSFPRMIDPPQDDPDPAVHPKQCSPVMILLCCNAAGIKDRI